MWSELNLEELEREDNNYVADNHGPDEVEALVCMVRLELYNRGEPCGPRALRRRLDHHYGLQPLLSERTIARILARHGLTGGRTGRYPGEEA